MQNLKNKWGESILSVVSHQNAFSWYWSVSVLAVSVVGGCADLSNRLWSHSGLCWQFNFSAWLESIKSLVWIVINNTGQVRNLGSILNLSTWILLQTAWLSSPKYLISSVFPSHHLPTKHTVMASATIIDLYHCLLGHLGEHLQTPYLLP